MIHIKRGRAPLALNAKPIKQELERARKFYAQPISARSQQRYESKALHSTFKRLEESVAKLFHNKCAYCESHVSEVGSYVLERFRPTAGAVGLHGDFSPDHYWWLSFEWSNLLIACGECNRRKANRFPIKNERAKILATGQQLRREGALLLDPTNAEVYPERHLLFDAAGRVASKDEIGRTTIEVLGLNRSSLLDARSISLTKFSAILEQLTYDEVVMRDLNKSAQKRTYRLLTALKVLKSEVFDHSSEFLAMKRQSAQQWASELGPEVAENTVYHRIFSFRSALTEQEMASSPIKSTRMAKETVDAFEDEQRRRERFSVESESREQKEEYYLKRRLIERIEIRNFKAIHN